MAERQYIDFDMMVSSEASGYAVRAYSQGRSAGRRFDFPFQDHELDTFYDLFGGRPVRSLETTQFDLVRAFGGRLFGAVFDDHMHEFLRSAMNEAERQGKGLRIRIALEEAPDLGNLPWEYLYRSSADDFPALSNWTPVVRFQPVEESLQPARVEPPLRILAMISNPIEYQDTLDAEKEWEQLQTALGGLSGRGLVHLERLEAASEESLQRELRRNDYHIFHFIGHGEFDERASDGVLLLEDERRRTKLVTGRNLGTILQDSRPLRLVVLNSCESARATDADPFTGAAQSLIRKGIPAVLAMQFRITDTAAVDFAREFYSGIGDGYPVDASLAEARKAIYRGPTRFEFGSPVLYMSSSDGTLFDIADIAPPPMEDDRAPVAGMTAAAATAAVQPTVETAEEPLVGELTEAGEPPVEAPAEVTEETPLEATEETLVETPAEVAEETPLEATEETPVEATEEMVVEGPPQRQEPPGGEEPPEGRNRTRMLVLAGAGVLVASLAIVLLVIPDNNGPPDTTALSPDTAPATVPPTPVTTAATGTSTAAVPLTEQNLDRYVVAAPHDTAVGDFSGSGTLEVREAGEEQAFGDFDGDGVTDVFTADGRAWFFSPGGVEEAVLLRNSSLLIPEVRFGDFNGDCITDLFVANGGSWNWSDGGRTVENHLISSFYTADVVRLGDFDGDGITDVFSTNGTEWDISWSSNTVWDEGVANLPGYSLSELRFGDFDGDATTDVFFTEDGGWRVAFGAQRFQTLRPAEETIEVLRFGDVDRDARTDVLYHDGTRWLVSLGGKQDFIPLENVVSTETVPSCTPA